MGEEFGLKLHQWSLLRVVVSELNLEQESATLPVSLLRAIDDSLPLVDVVLVGGRVDPELVVLFDQFEVLQQPTLGTR